MIHNNGSLTLGEKNNSPFQELQIPSIAIRLFINVESAKFALDMNKQLESSFNQIESRKEELLNAVNEIDSSLLNVQPKVGEWSIVQVINHLTNSEAGTLIYCKKKINAGSKMANITLFGRMKAKLFIQFLYYEIRYKMPKGLPHPSEELNFKDVTNQWSKTRKSLAEFLNNYPDEYLSKAIFKHPVAGRIGLNHTLQFFDAHLAHHEYQINRILKAIKKS